MNLLLGYILPLLVIAFFSYWTIKIKYRRRFFPAILLLLLAVLCFLIPTITASTGVIQGGFGVAVAGIYYSLFLGIGVLISVMIAIFIKKA
jgi:hypothetical protein